MIVDYTTRKINNKNKLIKLEKNRSAKTIQISRLQTRNKSVHMEKAAGMAIIKEVTENKQNNDAFLMGRHNSIPINANPEVNNMLLMPSAKMGTPGKPKKGKNSDETIPLSQYENKHGSDEKKVETDTHRKSNIETSDINETNNSNRGSDVRRMTDPISQIKSNPTEGINSSLKSDTKSQNSVSNCEQTDPVEHDAQEDMNGELDIIQEEHSQTYSTLIHFNQSRQNKKSSKNSLKGIDRTLTKQEGMPKERFLLPGNTLGKQELSQNLLSTSSPKTRKKKDEEMKNIVDNLKNLSTSNKDLKDISDELSNVTGTEFDGKLFTLLS